MSLIAYGQVIITEIADPNDNALARYVEIYNVSGGDVDLTGWELRRWTNANVGPQATGIDLSSVGILGSNSFVLIAASAAEFLNVYGVAADIDGGTAGAADSNGDDQIAIFDAADNTIDIFGVPGEDGTGTCHEFEDGRAERIESVSASNPVWDEAEWNVWADSPVTGCTSHTSQPVNAGDGIFDPGVWIGATSGTDPQINTTENGINGFIQFIGAPSPEQFFGVSGSNLTGDILMTVSGDFEISLTSGSGFSNSLTLPQNAGEVALTQVFVRLNGTVAGPVQEEIFLSDLADTAIVLLSGEILAPDPTILTSLDTLDGFSHFVGTPSAEQIFEVSGNYLTEDINLAVSGDFEISLTSGIGFTNSLVLPQTGGEVNLTQVFVRLNGAAQNLNQFGIVSASSANANAAEVWLFGETLDYISTTIDSVTFNDNSGIAQSLGDYVQLEGLVHCIDFDGNDGYSFTIIDSSDIDGGINVFSFTDVSGYVVNEGDLIQVWGQIDQYNGLTEIIPDSIVLLSPNLFTFPPTVVTVLDETTESKYITIENLDFVTPIATFPTGSNNIDVTDGTNVYTIRIDSDTDIPGTNTPQAPFSVTGVGGQFDNSNPYDSGYQLFPCGTGSFETSPTTGLNEGITNSIIAYPNPFNESISISILNAMDYAISVFDCNGRIVYSSNISSSAQISTSSWNRGVYIVEMKNELGDSKIQRLIK